MKVRYWSDYLCPFCYIGEANLLKALKRTGLADKVKLEMKAYELDPNEPKVSDVDPAQRLATKYNMTLERAQKRLESINRAGREAGLDMHVDKVRRANSFDAHRLTKYAQSLGDEQVTNRLAQAIFKAVFTDGKVISDHKVLKELALEAGLTDEAKIDKVLSSNEFANAVKEDEIDAYKQTVRGVPFFLIDDYVLPGAYPVEEFERILRQAAEKEQAVAKESAKSCRVRDVVMH